MGLIWHLIKKKLAGKKLTISTRLTTKQVDDLKKNRQIGFYILGIHHIIQQDKMIAKEWVNYV